MIDQPDDRLPNLGDNATPIPVYNCRVFLKIIDGEYHARVANLGDIQVIHANERSALSEIVRQFKDQIISLSSQGNAIPWLDPELGMDDDEFERLIPIHL